MLRRPSPFHIVGCGKVGSAGMPRAFDSDSDAPVLRFCENVTCPACGEIFEGEFLDHTQSLSVQDMVEPPRGDHQCPYCEGRFCSALTGWMLFGEAG